MTGSELDRLPYLPLVRIRILIKLKVKKSHVMKPDTGILSGSESLEISHGFRESTLNFISILLDK
jgi:hypothetical protein